MANIEVIEMYVTPGMFADIQKCCDQRGLSRGKLMRRAITAFSGNAQKPSLHTKRMKFFVPSMMMADILRVCGEKDICVSEYIRQAIAAYMRGMA